MRSGARHKTSDPGFRGDFLLITQITQTAKNDYIQYSITEKMKTESLSKSLLSILFIVMTFSLVAQKKSRHTPEKTVTQNENYLVYFDKIVQIEEMIAREQFDSSIVSYKKIFDRYSKPFARDVYNACQLAALQNHDHFRYFFTLSAVTGVSKKLLVNNRPISKLFMTDTVLYNRIFDSAYAVFMTHIDTLLKHEFEQRYTLEQKNKGKARYREICTDNFNRIVTLAKEGRFPGEHVLGPDKNLENSTVTPTLLHYPYSYKAMEPSFDKLLQSGAVQPMMALYLYSFNQTRTSILYTAEIPIDTENFTACYNMVFGKMSPDLATVNRNRKLRHVISTDTEKKLEKIAMLYRLDYKFGY